MRKQIAAIAVAAALACAAGAGAQPGPQARTMEAVVTITEIDPVQRIVRVRTPKGETRVTVPPEIDLAQVRPGARYRVRYFEPVAVKIEPGAQPSASAGATATVTPPSSAAAGEAVKVETISGVLEAFDPASRQITVRTLDGRTQAFRVAEGALPGGPLKPGEAVTLTYHQPVATQMVSTPQPERDPAPAQ